VRPLDGDRERLEAIRVEMSPAETNPVEDRHVEVSPVEVNSVEEFSGRVAVVTGSSSGIGRAVALELARAGADVVVHASSSRDAALAVRDEILAMGRRSTTVFADFSLSSDVDRFASSAWDAFGGVDFLVNNAGADILTGQLARRSYEDRLEALWRVDVVATIRLGRTLGARMKQRGSGVVINIGWDQAERGMEGESGELFGTTKGAIECFTKSLALNLAPEIRVNCVAPGWIRTAWGETAPDEWQARVLRETPLGRWGEPVDVARAIAFLVSPRAAYISGQTFRANGGAVR
jgi:3-oxoacyl-[acyl-carrier protein] reductase